MLKIGLAAALLVTAASALAQPQAPPAGAPGHAPAGASHAPPPELVQAGQAFGACIGSGIQGVSASVTPEAGAATVLAGCSGQLSRLQQLFESSVAASAMPETDKADARAQLRTGLAQLESEIAQGIRQHRAEPTPTP